jgi:superfamily I DNA/RNA helicase
VGKRIAGGLTERGLAACFMASRDLDLKSPGVKVLTLRGAKGLEFPIVALAGFVDTRYPPIPARQSEEARAEAEDLERRVLYVAMTRAMRALLVVVPQKAKTPLLQGFDAARWNLGTQEARP